MLIEYTAEKRILYYREPQEEFSPFKPYRYRRINPDGKDGGTTTVYCLSYGDFVSLLKYWTLAGYKYSALS